MIISDQDCFTIGKHRGKLQSGIYNVRLWKTGRVIPVYCDFETDTGGWTVCFNLTSSKYIFSACRLYLKNILNCLCFQTGIEK
jgi:hypothetical protein